MTQLHLLLEVPCCDDQRNLGPKVQSQSRRFQWPTSPYLFAPSWPRITFFAQSRSVHRPRPQKLRRESESTLALPLKLHTLSCHGVLPCPLPHNWEQLKSSIAVQRKVSYLLCHAFSSQPERSKRPCLWGLLVFLPRFPPQICETLWTVPPVKLFATIFLYLSVSRTLKAG